MAHFSQTYKTTTIDQSIILPRVSENSMGNFYSNYIQRIVSKHQEVLLNLFLYSTTNDLQNFEEIKKDLKSANNAKIKCVKIYVWFIQSYLITLLKWSCNNCVIRMYELHMIHLVVFSSFVTSLFSITTTSFDFITTDAIVSRVGFSAVSGKHVKQTKPERAHRTATMENGRRAWIRIYEINKKFKTSERPSTFSWFLY